MPYVKDIIDDAWEHYKDLCQQKKTDIDYIKEQLRDLQEKSVRPALAGTYKVWMIDSRAMLEEYLQACESIIEPTDFSGTDIGEVMFWKEYYTLMFGWLALKTGAVMAEKCNKYATAHSLNKKYTYEVPLYDGHNEFIYSTIYVRPVDNLLEHVGPVIRLYYPKFKNILFTPWDDLMHGKFLVAYCGNVDENQPNSTCNFYDTASTFKHIWEVYL